MRNKGQQSMSVLTVSGRLRLRRTRWHDAADCVTPADAWLDEAEATVSEGVREMICRLNHDATSFLATAANLKRTACLDISKEQVRQLVEAEGMRTELVTIGVTKGIFNAAEFMKKYQVRRLPIVDADGKLVGMVTMDDLFNLLARELANMTGAVQPVLAAAG